jgi:hypothetical protein
MRRYKYLFYRHGRAVGQTNAYRTVHLSFAAKHLGNRRGRLADAESCDFCFDDIFRTVES